MYTLNKIGPGGYYDGSIEVESVDSIPFGYTEAQIPDTLEEGYYLVFDKGEWLVTDIAPPQYEPIVVTDNRPEIIIDSVAVDINDPPNIIEANFTVTCSNLATVTYTGRLVDTSGNVIPLSDIFRMPVISDDGRKYILLAKMNNGIVTVVTAVKTPGKWVVTEEIINADLPLERHMKFKGLTLYVYAT